MWKRLEEIGIGNEFLYMNPRAQEVRARVDKRNLSNLNLLLIKGNNYENEATTHRMEENLCPLFFVLASYSKELISRIYEQLKNLKPKEQTIQIINGQINWTVLRSPSQVWRHTPVIPATWEAKISKIMVWNWLGQKVSETPSQ
jgi:hypothetical protein